MSTISTPFGKVSFTATVGKYDRPVTATLWEKQDKCRIYFKVQHEKGHEDCGFYDVKNKIASLKSSPAAWAHEIRGSISVEPSANQQTEKTFNTGLGYNGTAADAARGFDGIE